MFEQNTISTRRTFVKSVAAAAATTAILGQSSLSAYAASSQEGHNHLSGAGINVLLVHGAFVDASSWSKVIPLLQGQGYHVLAVQNPNTSLQDDIATTSQALASLSGPTILVGHSYGGFVISNVAASNVVGLVYASAYAPDAGETVQSINDKFPATPVGKDLTSSYRSGFIWIDPQAFPQDFVQDVENREARALVAAEKPLAPVCFGTPSGTPTWKTVPSWYLVSQHDRVINPDAERFMAKRMGATTHEAASSHASPVSHPKDVFDLIVAASDGIRK
ncbi:alpha/beta hydrolase [Dictyobacter alpinus]|uniref:Alpha/beta hydrolase n=2 Tax=Dictyobacter alpinus TaxID=2014873 RepID=A0A402BDJ8_9CHLR|nr:alpha/beta hydrolase [Dictyobacter alpinus]